MQAHGADGKSAPKNSVTVVVDPRSVIAPAVTPAVAIAPTRRSRYTDHNVLDSYNATGRGGRWALAVRTWYGTRCGDSARGCGSAGAR